MVSRVHSPHIHIFRYDIDAAPRLLPPAPGERMWFDSPENGAPG